MHSPSPVVGGVGVSWRLLHSGKAVMAAHPRITTHPSIVPRENDPRWEGELAMGWAARLQ